MTSMVTLGELEFFFFYSCPPNPYPLTTISLFSIPMGLFLFCFLVLDKTVSKTTYLLEMRGYFLFHVLLHDLLNRSGDGVLVLFMILKGIFLMFPHLA